MQSANRVTLNTGILYLRILLTMFISLYATRLLLDTLGEIDYGIYNLTAGLIAMLSFLSIAMSTSTQRFLSFHQETPDLVILKKIFSNSVTLHITIGILIVIVLEVLGFFLFDKILKIPDDRLEIAKNTFHCMSLTFFCTFIAIPFSGTLIAHENMLWIAIINIIEVIMKFILAWSLGSLPGDKLQNYAIFTTLISLCNAAIYALYCLKRYPECSLNLRTYFDSSIIKQISSFTGWNLFGSLSSVGKTQGIAILLNSFFGPIINASYAIANQVASQLNFFSTTMLSSLNPQIMKSEGSGDRSRMIRLSMIGSKFGFLMLAFIAIPCIFEMKTILKFWLKEQPEFASSFCSLILISVMVNQLTIGLDSAIQALGKIKKYMLIVGSIKLLILPISYLLLKLNFPVRTVLFGYAILEGVGGISRLFILKEMVGLSIETYIRKVIFPIVPTVILTSLLNYVFSIYGKSDLRFLYSIPSSIIFFFLCSYTISLANEERAMINKIFRTFVGKRMNLIVQ